MCGDELDAHEDRWQKSINYDKKQSNSIESLSGKDGGRA
jgi:hypothetical protein